MNLGKRNKTVLQWCFVILALLIVPGTARAQKKSAPSAPKAAPAAHAAPGCEAGREHG